MAGCTQQFDAELADKNPFAAQISKNAADTGRLQVTFTAVGYASHLAHHVVARFINV